MLKCSELLVGESQFPSFFQKYFFILDITDIHSDQEISESKLYHNITGILHNFLQLLLTQERGSIGCTKNLNQTQDFLLAHFY